MRDWKKSLENFTLEYKPLFESMFLHGSLAYGGKFTDTSDIDIAGTVSDLKKWKEVCEKLVPENKDFADRSIEDYLSGEAQSLVLNIDWQGILYQIDVMLPDFYKKAEADMNKNETVIYNRVSNATDHGEYILGHVDKRLTLEKPHKEKESTVIMSTPLCVIKDDLYFVGVYHQKLFTGYRCLWGDETDVKSFCRLAAKKTMEIGEAKTAEDVIKSSVRYDRMSPDHKKYLINFYS